MPVPDVKRIAISEFRDGGYLHEVNRLVLHPLGLGLEAKLVKEPGATLTFKAADLEEIREELPHVLKLLPDGSPERGVIERLIGSIERYTEFLDEGEMFLSGVWDCRDDPEGTYYGDDLLSAEKAKAVAAEMFARRAERIKALGYVVQPIPGEKVLTTNYVDPDAQAPKTQHVDGYGDVEFEQ